MPKSILMQNIMMAIFFFFGDLFSNDPFIIFFI